MFVNESMFWKKLKSLETILAERQGVKRGWFTYTELQNLLVYIDAFVLIQKIACLMAILAVTYTASVLTIVGSAIITNHLTSLKDTEPVVQQSNDIALQTINQEKIVLNRSIDAADVLKTGIFLASIKVLPQSCNTSENEEVDECVSWDWWNNPLMQWLSEKSKMMEEIQFPFGLDVKIEDRLLETASVLSKKIELGDHISKATKIRIQEQMERSWHKEWTDSIYKNLSGVKFLLYYFRDVKS